jgi:hypothetical protein
VGHGKSPKGIIATGIPSPAAVSGIQVRESQKWNQERAQPEMVDTSIKGTRLVPSRAPDE